MLISHTDFDGISHIEQLFTFLLTSDSDSSSHIQDTCNATDLHVASVKVSVWMSGRTSSCTGSSHRLLFICCEKISALNSSNRTCIVLDILCSGHSGKSNVLQTWQEHNAPKQKQRAGTRSQADYQIHFEHFLWSGREITNISHTFTSIVSVCEYIWWIVINVFIWLWILKVGFDI